MKWKLLLGCGIPIILISVLGVMGARYALQQKPKEERSEVVQKGDVEIKVVENGTIEPLRKVEVKSKVGGRIQKLLVDAGAQVTQGQIIASIDPQEINSQVEALRAQMASAQARLESARKNAKYQDDTTRTTIEQSAQNLKAIGARVRQAEAEAKSQPLLTQDSILGAQSSLEAAQARQKGLEDQLELMEKTTHPQAIVNAKSNYDQAVAQEKNATSNLNRQKTLLAKGFVSQQIVESAETEYEVAAARTRDAKERVDRIRQTHQIEIQNMKSQIAASGADVQQFRATLRQAKNSVMPTMKQQELQNARAAYNQAKSQLEAAKAGRTTVKMRLDDITSAEADVRQINNQLKERLVSQGDTTIRAPMTGYVTKRYVEEGILVTSAIGSFSSGEPIFQISDLSTMLIKTNINEVDIAKVKVGLLTEVTVDAAKGVIFKGRVRKVAPASQTAATGTASSGLQAAGGQSVIRFDVEIELDKADPRLKPGMTARCSIICERRSNVVRLPLNCVQGVGSKGTVQIVTTTKKEGRDVETATARPVTLGLRGDSFVEIVSGVAPNDKVRPNPFTGPPRAKINFGEGPPDN